MTKSTLAKLTPRSGRFEVSPAFQCRVRAKKKEGLSRASDKSPGYSQSSTLRTILMAATLIGFVLAFGKSLTLAQTPSATPSPLSSTQQTAQVPAVATSYRADASKPLPPLTRVGIDVNEQQPLTLREAITMALRNNKDIEVARD